MENTHEKTNLCNNCGGEIIIHSRTCQFCGYMIEVDNKEINKDINSEADIKIEEIVDEIVENSKINYSKKGNVTISNNKKVMLVSLSTIIPLVGQVIGLIISIILVKNNDDNDTESFGTSLFIASLIVFVIQCIFLFVLWNILYFAFWG